MTDPSLRLNDLIQQIHHQLSLVPIEQQSDWLEQLQESINGLKKPIIKRSLAVFWGELKVVYPLLERLDVQLDFVPELGVIELWAFSPYTADGQSYSWSAHWFDKPEQQAKNGLWGTEIMALEAQHTPSVQTGLMWAWAERFSSWLLSHLPEMAMLMNASEGISAFSIENPSTGLKLTAKML